MSNSGFIATQARAEAHSLLNNFPTALPIILFTGPTVSQEVLPLIFLLSIQTPFIPTEYAYVSIFFISLFAFGMQCQVSF